MSAESVLLGGRYRLLDVLGSGGMAVVHRARDELLERNVAVKILRRQFASDEDFVHRFRQEARNAASLSHPSIAPVFDTGADGDVEYIVMQLVDGPDLERVIAERGRHPVGEALRIATAVAEALQAAHDRGIVHRDVKPGNILLTASGEVRVVDFGIARALGAANTTAPGLLLGSVHYCSPEQVLGEPVGSASDVYSLGIVLYELLTGERPFDGPSPAAVALQRLHTKPRPPSYHVEGLPDGLDALVMRALERDPDRRYPTAGGLADAIRAWSASHPAETRRPARQTNPRAAAAAASRARTVVARRRPARGSSPPLVAAGLAAAAGSEAETVVHQSPIGLAERPSPVSSLPPSPPGGGPPARPPRPSASVAAGGSDDQRRRRAGGAWLFPLAALVLAVVGMSLVGRSLGGGGVLGATATPSAARSQVAVAPTATPDPPTPSPAPTPRATPTAEPTPTPEPTARPTARPTPAPTPRPAPALPARDPAETVALFYNLVEAHRFDEAAALWTARMRQEYPPRGYIDGRFAPTTRIDLRRNEITSLDRRAGTATVAVDLIEYRTVEPSPRRFVGWWELVLVDGRWLMDRPHF
jgi:eukaryotic-like serine/threonine-protein kinase